MTIYRFFYVMHMAYFILFRIWQYTDFSMSCTWHISSGYSEMDLIEWIIFLQSCRICLYYFEFHPVNCSFYVLFPASSQLECFKGNPLFPSKSCLTMGYTLQKGQPEKVIMYTTKCNVILPFYWIISSFFWFNRQFLTIHGPIILNKDQVRSELCKTQINSEYKVT